MKNHKMKAHGAASIALLSMILSAHATPFSITNIVVQGNTILLQWEPCADRYIVAGEMRVSDLRTGHEDWINPVISVPEATFSLDGCCGAAFFRVRKVTVVHLDPEIDSEVRYQLDNDKYQPVEDLYDVDLLGIRTLDLAHSDASNLTGVAMMPYLQELLIGFSEIASLAPVVDARSLRRLHAEHLYISDIQAISQLHELTDLDLESNAIADLTPLASLVNLSSVKLGHNHIADLAPLATLTNITFLDVGWNAVTDISPLFDNAALGGLGPGDTVDLSGNPLTDTNDVQQLRESSGATVLFAP